MIECKICNAKIENYQKLSSHIKKHKISSKEYYEKFFNIGKCKKCNSDNVNFLGLKKRF